MDITSYNSLRAHMQTGDLLAFSGRGLISRLIQWRTKSVYSHVGMLLRLAEVPDRLFLLHATAKYGVGIVPASRYLSSYRGEAWWVQMRHDQAVAKTPTYQQQLVDWLLMQTGRSYDARGVLQFVLPGLIKQRKADYFCSELVASALRQVGLLTETTFLAPDQLVRHALFQPPKDLA